MSLNTLPMAKPPEFTKPLGKKDRVYASLTPAMRRFLDSKGGGKHLRELLIKEMRAEGVPVDSSERDLKE